MVTLTDKATEKVKELMNGSAAEQGLRVRSAVAAARASSTRSRSTSSATATRSTSTARSAS